MAPVERAPPAAASARRVETAHRLRLLFSLRYFPHWRTLLGSCETTAVIRHPSPTRATVYVPPYSPMTLPSLRYLTKLPLTMTVASLRMQILRVGHSVLA